MDAVRRAQGFSLIEVIVVFLIITLVTTGTFMLSSGAREDKALDTETKRFMTIVQLCSDFATLDGNLVGLYIESDRYRFMVFSQDKETQAYRWQWLEETRFSTDVSLPENFSLALEVEEGFWPDLSDENIVSNTAVLNRDEFSLHDKSQDPIPAPQIEIEPTGLMTPFTLRIQTEQAGKEVERIVQATRLGRLSIKETEPS